MDSWSDHVARVYNPWGLLYSCMYMYVVQSCTFFCTFQHNHRSFLFAQWFSAMYFSLPWYFSIAQCWCRRISPCPRISPCSRISPPKCPCETDKPMGLSAGFYGIIIVSYAAGTSTCASSCKDMIPWSELRACISQKNLQCCLLFASENCTSIEVVQLRHRLRLLTRSRETVAVTAQVLAAQMHLHDFHTHGLQLKLT